MKFSRLSHFSIVFLFVLQISPINQVFAQERCKAPCEFRFAVYGDSRSDHAIHKEIVSRLVVAEPKLILTTGDVVEGLFSLEESWKRQWETYDEIVKGFKNIGVFPAVGNHDIFANRWATDQYEQRVNELLKPGTEPPLRPGSTAFFYAFYKGNVRFISINSLRTSKLEPGKLQYQWLESELRDAQAAGKFIIPYFHIAVFSIGSHGSKVSLQKILHPLFLKYGVKLVFQGHDHNYYRTTRCNYANPQTKKGSTKCGSEDLAGITYIVSGGGGAGLYKAKNHKERIEGDKFDMAYNYTIADVFPNEIVLTTYSSRQPSKIPYQTFDKLRCPINSSRPCKEDLVLF
jgi:hypothetical protein